MWHVEICSDCGKKRTVLKIATKNWKNRFRRTVEFVNKYMKQVNVSVAGLVNESKCIAKKRTVHLRHTHNISNEHYDHRSKVLQHNTHTAAERCALCDGGRTMWVPIIDAVIRIPTYIVLRLAPAAISLSVLLETCSSFVFSFQFSFWFTNQLEFWV